MSTSHDPIISMSQMVGDDGLDSPRSFPSKPDDPLYTLEQLLDAGKPLSSKSEPEVPVMEKVYKAHARVFLIDSAGNSEYEKILDQGMKGDVILGKREICDIKGSADFKVYLEWMVPSMQKRAKAKKNA